MLRALSKLESFYIDQDITIVTVTDLEGKINPLILQKAIDKVVKAHPLLSSEINLSDDGYFFSKRETNDDKIILIGKVNKDKRKDVILSELNKPLTKKNLVRFTLLLEERIGILKSQHMTLITTTHHAVSDGISCVALQDQILQTYTELSNDKVPTLTSCELMPAIEDLIPQDFTKAELDDYIERYNQLAKNYHPFSIKPAENKDSPIEIHYIQKKFTLKQTQTIIDDCKSENISVHGAICAANLLAIRDMFNKEETIDLSFNSPINVRSRTHPPITDSAMFSAAIGCTLYEKVTSGMSLIPLANNISATIKEHLETGDIFKSLLTYEQTRFKSKVPVSIGITNVGKVELSKNTYKLKVVSMNFIPRIPLPLLSACVITSGNKLSITYPFPKPYFTSNMIKKIAELASNYLLTIKR